MPPPPRAAQPALPAPLPQRLSLTFHSGHLDRPAPAREGARPPAEEPPPRSPGLPGPLRRPRILTEVPGSRERKSLPPGHSPPFPPPSRNRHFRRVRAVKPGFQRYSAPPGGPSGGPRRPTARSPSPARQAPQALPPYPAPRGQAALQEARRGGTGPATSAQRQPNCRPARPVPRGLAAARAASLAAERRALSAPAAGAGGRPSRPTATDPAARGHPAHGLRGTRPPSLPRPRAALSGGKPTRGPSGTPTGDAARAAPPRPPGGPGGNRARPGGPA